LQENSHNSRAGKQETQESRKNHFLNLMEGQPPCCPGWWFDGFDLTSEPKPLTPSTAVTARGYRNSHGSQKENARAFLRRLRRLR
jgi:hypothetical protein